MKVFTLRKDNKYHTEYEHSSRLSGWDPIDPNSAPSQIRSIDGLFKNVIAYLKNVETAFYNMNIVVGRVPSKAPVSKQLAKLNGKLKHDIQALKNEAVSAWKICVGDIRNAAKQARKDAALPRKDANWNNLLGMLDDIDAEETGDKVIIALAAVKKEARWLMSEPASIKKLITTSLTKRLKNKGVFSSASQTSVNKIVKACDEILKIGEKIYKLASDATEVLKKGLPRKDSESRNYKVYQGEVKTFTLRKDGILTYRVDRTKDGKFESHLLRMFKVIDFGGNKVQFASVAEASSAYAWIKDEYPQYKNRMGLNGNTIRFF